MSARPKNCTFIASISCISAAMSKLFAETEGRSERSLKLDKLERVHRRATILISEISQLSYEERLQQCR